MMQSVDLSQSGFLLQIAKAKHSIYYNVISDKIKTSFFTHLNLYYFYIVKCIVWH